jgi:hypothetical protein
MGVLGYPKRRNRAHAAIVLVRVPSVPFPILENNRDGIGYA